MTFQNKKILLISPEPWNHVFVSKHHYATHLTKLNNKVFFLNPPTNKVYCEKTAYENVFSVHYKGFLKGLRYLPSFLQKLLIRNKFAELQSLCGVKFDVVWSFDNSVFFNFKALPKSILSISHIVDLNQDFNTRKAAKTADLCIGVNQAIVDRLKLYNSNTILISHGVQEFPLEVKKIELIGKNRIKVIYMGNLAMPNIDWELLLALVNSNPDIDFLLVGDSSEVNSMNVKSKVIEKSNVLLTGKIHSDKIPQYLNSADILISLYDADYASNYATPHKMMEYLASGKVIISTWIKEYEDLEKQGLILMVKSNKDYVINFTNLKSKLNFWNSNKMMEKRKAYTKNNTYKNQIKRIEVLINS